MEEILKLDPIMRSEARWTYRALKASLTEHCF